jgi:acyl transferase domain-containing protein
MRITASSISRVFIPRGSITMSGDVPFSKAAATGIPIEIEALTRVFRQNTRETGYCAIGSVKASVGHTMSAAGVVSLIKVLLAMKHRAIPASLNMVQPNPACELAASPFVVNPEMRPWEPREGVRRAVVSGFGFSGSNAHIVLREAPEAEASASQSGAPRLFLISARSRTALAQVASNFAQYVVAQANELDLDALSWSLAAGRSHQSAPVIGHRQAAPIGLGQHQAPDPVVGRCVGQINRTVCRSCQQHATGHGETRPLAAYDDLFRGPAAVHGGPLKP